MLGQILSIFHHSEWVKFNLHNLRAKPAPVPSSPINAYKVFIINTYLFQTCGETIGPDLLPI